MRESVIYHITVGLTGVLVGVGLVFPGLWWVSICAVAYFLYTLKKIQTKKHANRAGFLFGVCKMLTVLAYFWSPYPIEWMGIEPGLIQMVLITMYWVPASVVVGMVTVLFVRLYAHIHKINLPLTWRLLLVPSLWVCIELFGPMVFSFVFAGPGSYINSYFSFGHIGYALAGHGVLFEGARLAGVYSLSFIAIFFAYGILCIPSYKKQIIICVLFGVTSLYTVSVYQPHNIQVTVVETNYQARYNFSVTEQNEQELEKFAIVKAALELGNTYIVLPEDFRFTSYFESTDSVMTFIKNISSKPVILIDSARVLDEEYGTVLRSYVYDSTTDAAFVFDKQYLVPQGEYVPFIYWDILNIFKKSELTSSVINQTTYVPGIRQKEVGLPNHIPAVLFCFESVNPLGISSIISHRETAPFAAHIVSHAWFKNNSFLVQNQLDTMLKVQSKYTQLPIVQAANKTETKMYLPTGDIVYTKDSVDVRTASLHTYSF